MNDLKPLPFVEPYDGDYVRKELIERQGEVTPEQEALIKKNEQASAARMKEAEAEIAAYEPPADLYKYQRAAEYPPLTDLADAIVKEPDDKGAALEAYRVACRAVKAKYPKPANGR